MIRSVGQIRWASRRRWPWRTPAAAAAGVRATIRLAWSTATGSCGDAPAATTDQSGQRTTASRGGESRRDAAPAFTTLSV